MTGRICWQRVLVAFGELDGTGVTGGAMTAAEAQQMADTHSSPVWDEVVAELTALEAAAPPPPPPEQPVSVSVTASSASIAEDGGSATVTIALEDEARKLTSGRLPGGAAVGTATAAVAIANDD